MLTGTPVVNLGGSNLVPGTYNLINFTGTLTGSFPMAPTSSPGGNFSYSFVVTSHAVQLVVTPNQVTPEWSVGGVTPIVDGTGTWQDGSTNFHDVSAANTGVVTFHNTVAATPPNYDVIFGAGGAGGAVSVTSPVVVDSLTLATVSTPYQFTGSNSITINAAGNNGVGINAGNSASIGTPVVLGAAQTWLVSAGQTLSVTGAISEANAGTLLTKGGGGTLFLGGGNSYTGGTNISAGSVVLGVNNALATTSAVTLSNAAGVSLNLNGFNQTLGELLGGGAAGGSVTLGGGTLTVGDSGTFTFGGTITAGAGTFTKQGTGSMTLSAANPFAGTVNVSGGTLTAGIASTFAAGATINVLSGGTLSATVAGAFTGDTIIVQNGATLTDTLTNEFSGATIIVQTGGTFAVGTFASTINGLSMQGGSVTGGVGGTLTSSTVYDLQAGTVGATLAGTLGAPTRRRPAPSPCRSPTATPD